MCRVDGSVAGYDEAGKTYSVQLSAASPPSHRVPPENLRAVVPAAVVKAVKRVCVTGSSTIAVADDVFDELRKFGVLLTVKVCLVSRCACLLQFFVQPRQFGAIVFASVVVAYAAWSRKKMPSSTCLATAMGGAGQLKEPCR